MGLESHRIIFGTFYLWGDIRCLSIILLTTGEIRTLAKSFTSIEPIFMSEGVGPPSFSSSTFEHFRQSLEYLKCLRILNN